MSSTITQTEQLETIPKTFDSIQYAAVENRRSKTFMRSSSVEKLRRFSNFVCAQHYYLLPVCLKSSQSAIRKQINRCLSYLKTMFLIYLIYLIQFSLKTLDSVIYIVLVLKSIHSNLKTNLKQSVSRIYKKLSHMLLIFAVYVALLLISCHVVYCVVLISLNLPPWGFFFLVGCLLIMTRLAVKIMLKEAYPIDEKDISKCHKKKKTIKINLNYIGKTLSNIKLF